MSLFNSSAVPSNLSVAFLAETAFSALRLIKSVTRCILEATSSDATPCC